MQISIIRIVVCVSIFTSFISPLYSQNYVSPDSSNTSFARSLFLKASSAQSRLNNGREYNPHNPIIKEHPFFESKAWVEGNIVYDNASFKNVMMLYDLAKDEVIVLNFLLPDKLSLVSQKVQQFDIHGHQFIYLKTDSLNKANSGGFYDLLYSNTTTVLVKRKKEVKVSNNTSLGASFNQVNQYFLMKGGILYPVKSLASVLKVFKDKKAELQLYLKKNSILFRDNPEKSIVNITTYYDQLSK